MKKNFSGKYSTLHRRKEGKEGTRIKPPIKLEEHRVSDLFTGVRGIAVKVLNRIERSDTHLERLLDHEIRNNDLNPQDKALLYEIVHGVIRWTGRLDWILSGFYKGQFSKAIPILKNALRVALYQILFLDKVPEFAAVNEAVEFVKKLQGQKPADITNAVLRNIIRSKNSLRYPDPGENLVGYYASYLSHPSWLVKRWLGRYGTSGTEALLIANNERPALTLRVNKLKTDVEKLKELMASVDLKFSQGKYLPEYFRLTNLTNITQWQYFTEGYFNIQDESAGFACKLIGAEPGMRILDMCAAPGGKTVFLADEMKNSGEIVALDRFEVRIQSLQKNLERLGITNVKAEAKDAIEYQTEQLFDRILIDAPCSGLGTLSKKPDIKWKKELIDIHRLNDEQNALINKAAILLKVGGRMVYSTCTIEPEENIDIVHKFLAANPNFRLVPVKGMVPDEVIDSHGCVQTLPHIHKIDGAFAALIERIK